MKRWWSVLCLSFGVLGVHACGGKSDLGSSRASALAACSQTSDCVVIPSSCCGSCGAATRGDARAVNRDRASEAQSNACGSEQGCPACYGVDDPALFAVCKSGTCQIQDLADDASAECTSDLDCAIRTRECCECGGDTSPGSLVAISDPQAFGELVCSGTEACGECLLVYPSGVQARCGSSGHCELVDTRLP